jgi:hypothetical protein
MAKKIRKPVTDESICFIPGKYRLKPMKEVSDGYLLTLYDAGKLSGALKEYVENRIPILRHRTGKE